MNNLDKTYTALLQDILDNGVEKKDRTGTGTLSVFGRQIRHNMSEGFPLLTTKKMHWKSIVTELLWFLRGDTNIKYLIDNDCHIWDGDAYKAFKSKQYPHSSGLNEFDMGDFIVAIKNDDYKEYNLGELGPIYGKQWRSWTKFEDESIEHNEWYISSESIDQIANSINLLKTDPDSRRNRVNAWNVGELDQMVLPPCHTDFQFYTRELSLEERAKWLQDNKGYDLLVGNLDHDHIREVVENESPTRAISLMWNQRSVDTFLGLPFNIASYGLLLEIIAKIVNMVPGELIGNLGDVHLYSNHIEQAKEQIGEDWTEELLIEHLQKSGMDALNHKARMEYVSKLPTRTREPFPLPTLKHMKTDEFFKILSEDLSMIGHLDNTDFQLENYQSHSTIKAPLSN